MKIVAVSGVVVCDVKRIVGSEDAVYDLKLVFSSGDVLCDKKVVVVL